MRPIIADPMKASILIKAMCVLHNYLCTVNDMTYYPPGYGDIPQDGEVVPGFWRRNPVPPLQVLNAANRSITAAASEVRERLANYFVGPGRVGWQETAINTR